MHEICTQIQWLVYTITYKAMINSEIGPFEIQLIITPSSRRVCKCSQQFLNIIIMCSFDLFSFYVVSGLPENDILKKLIFSPNLPIANGRLQTEIGFKKLDLAKSRRFILP